MKVVHRRIPFPFPTSGDRDALRVTVPQKK